MFNVTDNNNSFIIEFCNQLSEFDLMSYKNAYALYEGTMPIDMAIKMINPQMYCNYIDKAISNLNDVTSDTETLDNFFSKIYKSAYLMDKNISIPLQPYNEVIKIRPEYLTGISMEYETVVQKVLKKTMKLSDIKAKYINGPFFDNVKKQLVKTNVVTNDVRDLIVLDNPTIVKVDNTYIQASIIPAIRSAAQDRADLNSIAIMAKGKMISTYTDMNATNAAVDNMKSTGKIDNETYRTLQYVRVNFLRQYMNLCAYLTAMIIRKSSYYAFNMMQYSNLQNTIYNYFPEGELVLHEYVIDGNITEIDDTTLLNSILNDNLSIAIPHIQDAVGKKTMEISNLVAKKYNYKLLYNQKLDAEKYPYDAYAYASLNKTILDIASNIHKLDVSLNNIKDCVLDDVINSADLEDVFVTKYANIISSVPNISYYNVQLNSSDEQIGLGTSLALFNDITHFEKNVRIISSNVKRCYDYIQALIDKYQHNDIEMNENTFNELNSFLAQTMKNFKDYALIITKKLLERLDNLTEVLDSSNLHDPSEPEEFVPYDYSFEAYLSELDELRCHEKLVYEAMNRDYNALRNKRDRGVTIVYEDQQEASSDQISTEVKTDAQDQHNENNNTSTTTQGTNNSDKDDNKNPDGTKKNKESVIKIFKDFIKKIIDKFKNKSQKMNDTNLKWLAKVKNKILGLDYSNTKITVAPYDDLTIEKIDSDITSAINKINSVNASNLPAELKRNKTAAQGYIFGQIPQKIANEDSFAGRIKHFFTFGKNDKSNLITYSGDDAKNKVNDMITFCESYGTSYTRLSDSLQKLADAAQKKQQDILNTIGDGVKQESVLTEAQQNEVRVDNNFVGNSNDDKEKMNSSTVITSITREYAGAILTVFEKKYLDNIKVLNKLAPKDTEEKPAEKASEENNNQETSDNKEENK